MSAGNPPAAVVREALRLQSRTGWHLFPCSGKVPAISKEHGGNGHLDATNDGAQLVRLFSRAPNSDGFGVSCGRSGIAVLDVDVKDQIDGRDSLREARIPWLVETVRATTPRGGEHVFFEGVMPSRTAVLPAVDIKSQGGYVIVPAARGREWIADASPFDVILAPAPEWLRGLGHSSGATGQKRPGWLDAIVGHVREGARNETAASIAGHLLKRGVDPQLAGILIVAWSRSFCEPPLDDSEVLGVVRSITAREGCRR